MISKTTTGKVTGLLMELSGGNRTMVDELIPFLYPELKRIAAAQLRLEPPGPTLQVTALVNEAYLKLVDQRNITWKNRAHFAGVAATVMRCILLDYARAHTRQKRGGAARPVSLDEALLAGEDRSFELLQVDAALQKLEALDSRQAKVVEMRFFGGLSVEETAEALGISGPTVQREWTLAKASLYREFSASES